MKPNVNPNIPSLLPAKTAKFAPERAICALARLGEGLTHGQVRFNLPESSPGHIWRTLARFFWVQPCNDRVKAQQLIVVLCLILTALCPAVTKGEGKSHWVECDVHNGPCIAVLPDRKVSLDIHPKPVRAMQDLTFTVTLTGETAAARPYIDLGMVGMNMGRNRVVLRPAGASVFKGTGVFVRCPSGRRTWKAKVTVPERGSVEFVFDVIY